MTDDVTVDLDAEVAALMAAPASKGGIPCTAGKALEVFAEAHPEQAERVAQVVSDPAIPAGAAAAFLAKHTGLNVKDPIVRRHRRRGTVTGCACPA